MIDIEQAKQELKEAPNESERLRLLLLHSKNFYRNAPKEAEKLAREALRLAKKLKDAEGIARAHLHIGAAQFELNEFDKSEVSLRKAADLDDSKQFQEPLYEKPLLTLGLIYCKRGNFVQARNFYEKALLLSRKHHRHSEVDILGALGNAALEQGDYPKASEYQFENLAILDRIDDSLRRSVVLSNIGWIYLEVDDLSKAENYFQRSYVIKKNIQDISGLSTNTYNLGIIAHKKRNYDEAKQLYKEALRLALSIERKESTPYIENSLGNLELDLGNPKSALMHFDNAIQSALSLNLHTILCGSFIGKSKTLLSLKRSIEAIGLLKKSLMMSEESALLSLQCDCVSVLASAYEASGKLKESVEYFKKFLLLNSEVHSEKKQRALVEISARVEIEKADRERERMERIAKDAHERTKLLRTETERQSKELTVLALQLVERNEFLCTLKEEIEPAIKSAKRAKEISEKIDAHIKSDRDWETFEHQFDSVHKEFLKLLAASFPSLTPMELRTAVLIKLNLSTKSIASLLCLSTRTVENHRQGIRRKLQLSMEENLVSFLTAFGERNDAR